MRSLRRRLVVLALASSVAGLGSAAWAEESQFGYVYTTDLLPKGQREIEQWVTWRHQQIAGYFDSFDLRTEVEYGLTDKLQTALYANYAYNRAFHNGPDGATTPSEPFASDKPGPDDHYSAWRFVGASGELIYRVLSPYTDLLGVAFYLEPTFGPQFREVESKLILQKNFLDDRLILAFNATYAPEWRHLYDDNGVKTWQEETDFNLDLAASYRFAPNWSAGFEFLNEREYADSYQFSHISNNGYYVGPSLHYGGKSFFVTAVFLEQMPWAKVHADTVPDSVVDGRHFDQDFEKYRVRIKAGFYF